MCSYGVCVGDRPLPELGQGCSLERKDPVVICDHDRRRRMRVAWRGGLPGGYAPGVHASCACNERAALLMRTLGPLPGPENGVLGESFLSVFRQMRRLAHRFRGHKWSYLETAQSYTGAMGRRYAEAERSLREDGPLGPRDFELQAFLKGEKIGVEKFAKPRMIFPRSPRYNLSLASYLKPFEHWLWGYLTFERLFGGRNQTRVSAKGLSPRSRANLILRKMSAFRSCVVFEVDGKAFEAHVSREQLAEEHSVYRAAYPGQARLRRLLRHQLRLVGRTEHRWKFSREGGRASGDFNTGMGNTLIMLAVVGAALQTRGIPWDVLADGDNALIFVESDDLERVLSDFSEQVLKQTGHEVTLERPVRCPEDVRFGQSAPVFLGDGLGWTMVRDPRKVLSGCFASYRWLGEPLGGQRWCAGVARCELSLARGLPVTQAVFLKALKRYGHLKPLGDEAYRDYFVVGAHLAEPWEAQEPTLECRLSYARAFGISPDVQLALEASLDPVLGHAPSPKEHYTVDQLWEAEPGDLEDWADAQVLSEWSW